MLSTILFFNLLLLTFICIPHICSQSITPSKFNIKENNLTENVNNDITSQNKHEIEINTSPKIKKWQTQVGSVRRKQYEIINMLWLKTNICIDIDTTTESSSDIFHTAYVNRQQINHRYQREDSSKVFLRRPKSVSSTPTYIEFYYLDETDDSSEQRMTTLSRRKLKSNRGLPNDNKNNFVLVSDSPIFALRINDENYKILPTNVPEPVLIEYDISNRKNKYFPTDGKQSRSKDFRNIFSYKVSLNNNLKTNFVMNSSTLNQVTRLKNSQQSFKSNISSDPLNFRTTATEKRDDNYENNATNPTTLYDKIKFFEMYDSHTYNPLYRSIKLREITDSEHLLQQNEVVKQKVLLEHVDHSMENINKNHFKPKFAKKHIIEENKIEYLSKTASNNIDDKNIKSNMNLVMDLEKVKTTNVISNQPEVVTLPLDTKISLNFRNKTVPWAEYPFAALYVYETGQVHCDAAAISPHWLIAAGSCLSRHDEMVGNDDGRSAYVAYCGERWWIPERLAYVKSCFVHPRFHQHDRIRRHLYNIGVIGVVSSMASCTGWAPISLMSHQFTAGPEETVATAVGWGVDRFDTRYTISDLPKTPLTVYEAMVYTESCPGNIEYSKAKHNNEDGVNNVYCLSLPPYFGEENDLTHGGILLSGGKLIAVYLQEERLPWGSQCAQYTGTWQLIPWVLDVAREPIEVDAYTLQI